MKTGERDTPMNIDERYMAAAIRYARRHEGLTGTNPSVACVIVRDAGDNVEKDGGQTGRRIVGSGITAAGGRPHAEPIALAEAGELARGATAYVTLEPCAHHGATPPCAQTLIDAGIARVVTAVTDPDLRVNSAGHAMLRAAGILVEEGCLTEEAADGLSAYLVHKRLGRPMVTLKLAVSADGLIGLRGAGQVKITGKAARDFTHMLRARNHAILVGSGTVSGDDPQLTCRLPGLVGRSPQRILLDPSGSIALDASILADARKVPVAIAAPSRMDPARREALEAMGVRLLACETVDGRVALPELLEDLGATGIQSLMVEGGAAVAAAFLDAGLVDEIVLLQGNSPISDGIHEPVPSPIMPGHPPQGMREVETLELGGDRMTRYKRRLPGEAIAPG